ncbi:MULTISPECIES: RNA polymerase sigma factor [unclassified Microbacterium]|uniref:RNA polymerase sigma factor n=1 Tax=unclassified Microbacterium TaxID=2609290 RepID=UPI00203541DB|nr:MULTISPECIES: sigma-70 family RNA polymerase sigma factor [unclassified Microbacterium]
MIDGAPGAALDPASDDGPARWKRAAQSFDAWREGDSRAMDELVRLMTPVLWHVVRAYGLERTLAEDVVQTTWLRLVRGHVSITDPRAVAAWLTTTARREAWKVGKASNRIDTADAEDLDVLLPEQASAEEHAAIGDENRRLWAAVQRLAERCQRLLRVIAFDDRPDYARLAADLAMPIGSIGPTRNRCLAKLRALLDAPLTPREEGLP